MDFAFRLLAKKLDEAHIHCRICIYGGAALVYAYQLRGMSMDIDYRIIFLDSETVPQDELTGAIRKIIRQTGEELGLSPNWMNDGVKGFTAAKEEYADGLMFGEYAVPALEVVFPSPEYLLAMKCIAMRDKSESPHDRDDILKLVDMTGICDVDSVLDVVQKFYPLSRLSPRVEFGVRELLEQERSEEEREVEYNADIPGI